MDKGPVAGYEAEAQGFGELAMTPQSKGLIGLFRGQTECKKNRFGQSQVDVKTVSCLMFFQFIEFKLYQQLLCKEEIN